MSNFNRRNFLRTGLLSASFLISPAAVALAKTSSLSDLGKLLVMDATITIYSAREIVTLDPSQPTASAVAVVNDRILACGTLDEVKAAVGDRAYQMDTTFQDKVVVPGFIAQHAHPLLASLSMSSEILSIEDWELPTGTVPALKDKADFVERLMAAEAKLETPEAVLFSWGYHAAFYGPLTRSDLDEISSTRPVVIWLRSCHEFVMNSFALNQAGITQEIMDGWSKSAKEQSNFEEGHFWEQGMFSVLPHIAPMVANPDKFQEGAIVMRNYMHAKGITFGNEPGGILAKPVQDAVNSVMSDSSMPFRWSFMADGKTLAETYADDAEVIAETEKLESWYNGMTHFAEGSVKLFADGAIYSLAMQLRDPYIGDYHGEWMMDEDLFERSFRIYWDAGYQIHIHVNGDAGLDRVLNSLETNLKRNPRSDHRTTIIHFAVSAADQVDRIKQLGAIVSANPYYVTALSDQYSETGLGPERADQMVRLGDVERAGISYSLHSDMPMAPADPLFLMWCAVNRITSSGRVAGEGQRVSREGALRGVTLDAAYSHRLEHERGSIEVGKLANFTILDDNPLTVDPVEIKNVGVWGTVMEGRKIQVGQDEQEASLRPTPLGIDGSEFAKAAIEHAIRSVHSHG
ncbi:amidohydrolase [Sedimentitalea sp. CY04]|uniref:Amidohydrolase n=1 Tax=Parasedimentitalea denitrificans TaxID=2211118 RepID=A0ABX0W1W2_9RHOB|nr:amidohydrolase [Sedimentitalea sp. CY04]NIZ59534.1 amidohydrolase [Sedimentitalea sp. CY04]